MNDLILWFINILISEISAFIISIDYSFLQIFFISSSFIYVQQPDSFIVTDRELQSNDFQKRQCYSLSDQRGTSYLEFYNYEISWKDVNVLHEMLNSKLGVLYKAEYQGKQIVIRKIEFDRISGYMLEDFHKELMQLKELQIDNLLPVCKAITEKHCISLIMQFQHNSLSNFMHDRKESLDGILKLKIAKKIAKIMVKIHLYRAHGHLTPNNIFYNDNKILISDLGFDSMKKYASIQLHYTNKTAYSSPEILLSKQKYQVPTLTDDIYSFGIIL